jgi:hypothetical protein
MFSIRRAVLATVAVSLCAFPASAQKKLQLRGFGGWAYGYSDELQFSLAKHQGNSDTAEFGLNVTGQIGQGLRLIAQGTKRPNYEGGRTVLDYAFAEYAISDALKVRAGRVKHPFGLYGEIYHIGTLRPLYILPQSIYGGNGFTAQSYDGAGVTGSWSRSDWTLQYDAYGGEMSGDFRGPGLLVATATGTTEPILSQSFDEANVAGARIQVQPPVPGLAISASAYQGKIRFNGPEASNAERHDANAQLLSVEYATDRLLARGEYGQQKSGALFDQRGHYLELAYKIAPKWQLASRWDVWDANVATLDVPDPRRPRFVPQLVEHDELAFGVNFAVRSNVVVRASYHIVNGNRYAYPDNSGDVLSAIISGELRDGTNAFVIGTQFHF